MFNKDSFDENVDYCQYVSEISSEKRWNFTNRDIQTIANMYVYELECNSVDFESEVVKDNKLLFKVILDYLRNIRVVEKTELSDEEKDLNDRIKLENERKMHSRGGHGYNESYDDLSDDQFESNFTPKF